MLYGWQHTLVDISPFVLPLAVAGALGMTAGEEAGLVNACLFAMGIATWILAEGVGSALAVCLGALPCTSYTQNVGVIAATGVASRAVVRVAGGILLLLGSEAEG